MTTARILLLSLGFIGIQALNPVPHQTSEESLRGALNAVTRKQRSLNANPQAYYEYRMDNGKLQRQQVAGDEEQDDNEDNLAFIPAEGVGQLETIGDGYQHLNNRQLEKALMDYLQFPADQEAPAKSMFRERERISGSKKRNGGNGVTSRLNGEDLVKLLLEQLDSTAPDGLGPSDDEEREYQRTTYKYHTRPSNPYVTDPQLLREILDEQDRDEDEEPRQTSYPRFPTAERRNVNALRYPLFNRDYKNFMYKRFPVAKRSAKAANKKRQATDPKVAQDLGALFGTQSGEPVNHTHDHDHDHDHGHNHDHNEREHHHDHDHDHDHDQHRDQHDHDHDHHSHVSEAPETKLKNTKESIGKENKTKERTIEVKKKSVDWSQYFGIDRRKKKAVYVGRPGSQDQDNEYLLQKYYEIMAENLNPNKDASEKRDKLQRMDAKLRNMKNQLIEEATQISARSDMNDQDVKDDILSKLATAYSLEKLRRALRELSDNAAAERAAQNQNNLTAHHPNEGKSEDKRFRSSIDELQAIEKEGNCPQVDIIERNCKATEALIGDYRQVLLAPCVMFHICNACQDQEECLERFAVEAERICQEEDLESTPWSRKHCVQAAMQLPRHPPPVLAEAICRLEGDEPCLAPYQTSQYHRSRYLYTAKR